MTKQSGTQQKPAKVYAWQHRSNKPTARNRRVAHESERQKGAVRRMLKRLEASGVI